VLYGTMVGMHTRVPYEVIMGQGMDPDLGVGLLIPAKCDTIPARAKVKGWPTIDGNAA